ncbi:MAG: hypothetical protein P4M08_11860 [Oligoflexia bacterium]|nr:hypothetical protein [Oligoflexia bacterium]
MLIPMLVQVASGFGDQETAPTLMPRFITAHEAFYFFMVGLFLSVLFFGAWSFLYWSISGKRRTDEPMAPAEEGHPEEEEPTKAA